MARDGSGIYSVPPGLAAVENTTIESAKYNAQIADIAQDLNVPRPIIAGGTGATNAGQAMTNLGGERAGEQVVNYDSHIFRAGSFWSAPGAIGAPNAHGFAGICFSSDPSAEPPPNLNLVLDVRDLGDSVVPGTNFIREKKAGVWGSWTAVGAPISGSGGAASVGFAPAGTIAATNVQAAIQELDGDIQLKAPITSPTFLGNPTAPTPAPADNDTSIATTAFVTAAIAAAVATAVPPRGFIDGLTMAPVGNNINISAGAATNSTTAVLMTSAFMSKNNNPWAAGSSAGGKDTAGVAANNTWYHFYMIRNPSTLAVDFVYSTNASSPTLPSGFTQFRRIGAALYGSGAWATFVQEANVYTWLTPVADVAQQNPGTARILRALTVPQGIKTIARFNAAIQATANADQCPVGYFYDPACADVVPNVTTAFTIGSYVSAAPGTTIMGGQVSCHTNVSRQIATRLQLSAADTFLFINTTGWIDPRGQNV